MNASFVLEELLLIVAMLLLNKLWERRFASSVAHILLLLNGMGWIVVEFAPADVNENLHVVLGAVPIFFCGKLGLVLMGNRMRVGRWQPLFALISLLGTVRLVWAVLFLGQRLSRPGDG